MNKVVLTFTLALSTISFSQDIKTAIFPDGSEVDYQMLANDARDIPTLNVWLFDMNTRATFSFGTSVAYSMPDYFLTKFHIGLGGSNPNTGGAGIGRLSIENTIFFKTIEKEKVFGLTLKSISDGTTTTRFKVKEKLTTRRHLGARLGYLHGDFRQDVYSYHDVYKANELSVGFSYVNTKYFKIKRLSGKKPKTGSKMGRTSYYAELLHYHNVGLRYQDPYSNWIEEPGDNVIGYRLALDGQVGGRFGMSYTFGFERPPAKDKYFDVFFGFGMYLAFL